MVRTLHSIAAGVAAAALALSAPVQAQQKLKIGFITTLSGAPAIIGKHMQDSVEVALELLGGKVGGLETEVIYGDDQFKPDVGVQLAEEMLKKHQVDFVSGIIWSNVMMAVVPVVTGAGKIMVRSNAGASPRAGRQCNYLYFSTSCEHDQSPEAMCKYLQDKGINDLYVLSPLQLSDGAIFQSHAVFCSRKNKIPASPCSEADRHQNFGFTPSLYAAHSYDPNIMTVSEVRARHNNQKDNHALDKAMRKADI